MPKGKTYRVGNQNPPGKGYRVGQATRFAREGYPVEPSSSTTRRMMLGGVGTEAELWGKYQSAYMDAMNRTPHEKITDAEIKWAMDAMKRKMR
jgi:hypothetical protein